MRNILDAPGFDKPEEEEIKTNFQKWAFRLFLVTVFLRVLKDFSLYYWYDPSADLTILINFIRLHSLVILLALCGGIFCTILSIAYNEIKNFRFTIAAVGFFILILTAFA